MKTRKNQAGVTIFEAAIVLLLLILIGLSCFTIMRRMQSENRSHQQNLRGIVM